MSLVFKVNIDKNWSNKDKTGLESGLAEMSTDILTKAKILAPAATHNLVNSGRIKRLGQFAYQVGFGDAKVPYARKRHFENKKHPATLEYLTRAGEAVNKNQAKYFRNKV